MRKISKQIFKGQATLIDFNAFFFWVSLETTVSMFFFLTFLFYILISLFHYILVRYSIFGKHKLGNCFIDQTGSTAFNAEFLTVADNLLMHISQHTKFQKNLRR